jgi:hypothetical protein
MALNAMHKSSFMGCADKPLLRQITDTIGRSLPQAKRPRPSEATIREGQVSGFISTLGLLDSR